MMMMTFDQANVCRPCAYLPKSSRVSSNSITILLPINRKPNTVRFKPLLAIQSRQLRSSPVCLHGSKGRSGKNEEFPWESLKKGEGHYKGKSIEEVLREQMEKKEFHGSGGGKKPPRGGGGGNGGGGSGKNADGSEGKVFHEVMQIFFATLGFLALYFYLIFGQEVNRLARDYIIYLFKGKKSVRLRRVMNKCRRFLPAAT
ncbi:hypothetical protein ACFE04_020176 [Oxalis oulophora]